MESATEENVSIALSSCREPDFVNQSEEVMTQKIADLKTIPAGLDDCSSG